MALRSPCIDVCQIDRSSGLCVGCLRTLEEIRRWPKLTDHRRHAIVNDRPRRERKLEAGKA